MRMWTLMAIGVAVSVCRVAGAQPSWPTTPQSGRVEARTEKPKSGLQVDVLYDVEAAEPEPGPSPPFFNCPPTEVAPVIDGRLDDKVWQAEAQAPAFVLYDGGEPWHPTQAWMAWDKDNIYVAFRCDEPQVDMLAGERSELDADLSGDDYVAVQFEPANRLGAKGYFELRLNCRGGQWDGRCKGPEAQPDAALWDPVWTGAVDIGGDYWSAEIEIAFKEIRGRAGGMWGINFVRHRYAGLAEETSFWTPLGGFGWVMFGRSKLVLTDVSFPKPIWGNNGVELTFDSPAGNVWISTSVQPKKAGAGDTISTSLGGGSSTRLVPVTLHGGGPGRVAIKVKGPRDWARLPTWWMPWEYSMGVWVLQTIAGSRPVMLMGLAIPYELPELAELGAPGLVKLGGQEFIQVPLSVNAEVEWLQTLKWSLSIAPQRKKPRWQGQIGKLRAAYSTLNIEAPTLEPGDYTITVTARSHKRIVGKAQTGLRVE